MKVYLMIQIYNLKFMTLLNKLNAYLVNLAKLLLFSEMHLRMATL